MPLLRILVEQGLLGLLWIARSACFAQGSHRQTFVGGAALVALGALLPRLPRRG